jgi:hypothetical protein
MMILTGLGSLAVSVADLKPYVHLPLVPHLTRDLQVCPNMDDRETVVLNHLTAHLSNTRTAQLYRLVVHQIVFQNSVELFMAELMLYHMARYIERYRYLDSRLRPNAQLS